MPSGRTHDRITIWCLPIVAIGAWGITQDAGLVLAVSGCFLFSGWMFGPDLDIYSQQYRRWGWLRWIWLPYRHSMAHRSLLSHGLLIGSLLRVLYIGVLLGTGAVFSILGWSWAKDAMGQGHWLTYTIALLTQVTQPIARSLQQHSQVWLGAFVGLELGAMSHSLSDWIDSGIKRLRKRSAKNRK